MKKRLAIALGLAALLLLQSCSLAPRYVLHNMSQGQITLVEPTHPGSVGDVYAVVAPGDASRPFALPVEAESWSIRAGSCVHVYPTADWELFVANPRALSAEEQSILRTWKRKPGVILHISFSQDGVVRAYTPAGGTELGREVTAAGFPIRPDTTHCD